MANRVTGEEVKEIFNTDMTADFLAPFITAANLIVTEVLGSSDLSAAHLKEIERWLTAHIACSYDPRAKSETVDDISVTYEGAWSADGNALKATSYGRQVMLLDTTTLLSKGPKRSASFTTLDFLDGGSS